MAAKKVGELIKEARTEAGLSQEGLAKKIDGLSASDIGKAERGEKELTQAALKQIAKATGVTQASLLNAAAGKAAASAGKTASTGKTAAAGKTAAKKPAAGKTASTAKKTGAAKSSMQLTAAEKKLVELYRKADADTKKEVMKLLKGTGDDASELLTSLLSNAMSMFGKRSMPGEEGGEEGEEQEGGLVLKEE